MHHRPPSSLLIWLFLDVLQPPMGSFWTVSYLPSCFPCGNIPLASESLLLHIKVSLACSLKAVTRPFSFYTSSILAICAKPLYFSYSFIMFSV
ncbi:hypothetical protein O6H91_04G000100 [Diphasiastrum complanatum]|uniref:Uncharacterized protein n=1 Tax=Diphasiastrum complanatum TaxID=34168 RepID=A0ACC2DTL2_DIPCM|nr:hypothetical protein O6H91_04G000100 [Diphasiastrum complanatum]